MNISGEALLHAAPEAAWAALHDTALLARCVPGCDSIRWLGEDTLHASLVLNAGVARRRYEGRIRIADAVELESYRLLLGSHPESPSVESRIRLEPAPAGTAVYYDVEAKLDGYLERLGTRAASGIARGLAARFFKRLDALLRESSSIVDR